MARKSMITKPPKTDEELATQMQERKLSNNRFYKNAAEMREINDAQLSKLIDISLSGLQHFEERECVCLTDTETIKQISMRYLDKCREYSVVPTLTDLANALGSTRRTLYDFFEREPKHPTTIWIRHMQDVFSDILSRSALTGATAPIPSIFVLKSRYGWSEGTNIIPDKAEADDSLSPDTIMEKYSDLPDD